MTTIPLQDTGALSKILFSAMSTFKIDGKAISDGLNAIGWREVCSKCDGKMRDKQIKAFLCFVIHISSYIDLLFSKQRHYSKLAKTDIDHRQKWFSKLLAMFLSNGVIIRLSIIGPDPENKSDGCNSKEILVSRRCSGVSARALVDEGAMWQPVSSFFGIGCRLTLQRPSNAIILVSLWE